MEANSIKRPELTFPRVVAEYVANAYAEADCILEYGSGGSTVLASEMKGKTIYSVESDKAWAKNLKSYIQSSPLTQSMPVVHHVDIGETKKWGYPASRQMSESFPKYSCGVWQLMKNSPDLILIDGRFRVSCFVVSLALAKEEAIILVDDFIGRKEYETILKYFEPIEIHGRMAKFKKGSEIFWPNLFLDYAKYSRDPR